MFKSCPVPTILACILGLAPVSVTANAAAAGSRAALERRVVLPAAVTPERYRIDITPDVGGMTFKGSVQIDVNVHRATPDIVLNSADIVIDHAELSGGIPVKTLSMDDQRQTATLSLDRQVAPGSYTLTLSYHGIIYRQASGLFALDYNTGKGKARALFTQFENSDARRFVPCWDEPGRKAVFELTATVPADDMAVSNMPVASTDMLAGHLKRVHFAPTPRMSSYLLFFGVGDFERVHRDVGGIDVGIVVKRGDTATTAFALDAASSLLGYYNDYFGTPYPLPKLDLIAAPGGSQFFSAMENWGAIFYFERDLLIDARISTDLDRQNVYVTVAHEMAHQWFGDLVTMAWWDDLWLNEGFASWMETKATDHFHPEWQLWLQSTRWSRSAMDEDSRDGTHPIITPIDDVLQASSAFDTITYTKGAAVIRMLESYVGEQTFREGVRRYLRRHAYGNTTTDDLWKAVDEHTSRPLSQIAHDFTLQAGVPEIAETSNDCRSGDTILRVAQGHFAIDPHSTPAALWHVPVAAAHPGAEPATHVISGGSPQAITLTACGATILNAGQTGYFRTRYSESGLKSITSRYAELPAVDQLGLLDDTRALAYTGQEPMSALLDLATHIRGDADPQVALALVSILRHLDTLYDGLPTQPAFRNFALQLLNPWLTRIGWDPQAGESSNRGMLRRTLIEALSMFHDQAVLGEARRRFDQYLTDPSGIDPATRESVLEVVALHADQSTWERLRRLAKEARTELEREEYYQLLAAPESDDLTRQALQLAISGEPPATSGPGMISQAAGRHPAMAFHFAADHWESLAPFIEPASAPRFMPGLLSNTAELDLIRPLEDFAAAHIPDNARQDVRKTEANIRYLSTIRRDRLGEVDRWIGANDVRPETH